MKNLQKGFIAPLLLVIVAILVISGGTYYFVQKSKTPQVSVPVTTTTTVTGSTVAQAEMAGWKTYTNYAYAFPKDSKMAIMTFSFRFVQCGNYPDKEMGVCEAERQNFNIDDMVDGIAQSLKINI